MSNRTRYGMDRSAMNPNAIKLKPLDPPEPSKAITFIPHDVELATLHNTHSLSKPVINEFAEALQYIQSTTSLTINTSHMTREQIAELTTQVTEIMHKITPNQGYIYLDESTPFTEEHAKALDSLIESRRIKAR